MARKKISLQRIANNSNRRATFRKRRKGLIKKTSELATLCDVDACLVIYGEGDSQPEVWPSVPQATALLDHFKSLPDMEQYKKMMNQEDFVRQSIAKLWGQVNKARYENNERATALFLHDAISGRLPGGLAGLTVEQLSSLDWIVKTRIQAVNDRLRQLNAQAPLVAPSQHPALLAPPLSATHSALPAPSGMPPYSLVPVAPSFTAPPSNMTVMAPPPPALHGMNQDKQAWLMDVARTGDLGAVVYSGFTGGASTSNITTTNLNPNAGGRDMIQFPNPAGPAYGWSSADAGPSSFPPM
ncbi:hypothetical protein GUJ93_ZPchr0562g2699 [Zizania palustris]|uniref:MADS-box domain-containing protein n=2 Tax=Zizania palustris TaxID=103762 RepID=A0A8J5R0H0_ZIZPA|nr:hypothetical protein GUJ93_ZPchr0651g22243 [Zizania palustris]KAG8051963.1 hypothetical protein GUJ93_ZPchr0001g32573 [Zizania palustris]KAG8051965.1 hypothetical protein GUJ93_ZPchr0001g32426 [Zizania palustris]KAG8100884.1 hypothetical protein GUJ93_ZPchr0562g2699 [Zizania palustris]